MRFITMWNIRIKKYLNCTIGELFEYSMDKLYNFKYKIFSIQMIFENMVESIL